MNTLLKQPDPVTNGIAWGRNPSQPDGALARQLTTAQPQARILYVDDDPQLRRLSQLVLVRWGYDVHTAGDGVEGWNALQHAPFHLLITDNDMPRLTGLELARQARLAGMRLPIVLVSGSADALADPAPSWLGLAARLPKPFGAETLVETVEQILRIANGKGERVGVMISVLARAARAQPFLHGGINE